MNLINLLVALSVVTLFLGTAALGAIYYTTKDIEQEIKDIKSMLENYKQ